MESLEGRWYDENRNSWDQEKYSKEEACAASRSLTNCYDCHDCHNCHNCYNLHECRYCFSCHSCHDCFRCHDCHHCYSCHNCHDCHRCHDCHNCYDCDYCYHCKSFNKDPRKFTSGNIGSSKAQTTFFWNEDQNQIVCGCYHGSLDEFETRVEEVHRDCQYGDEYKQFIKQCRSLLAN